MQDFLGRVGDFEAALDSERWAKGGLLALASLACAFGLVAAPAHAQETQTYSYDVHGRLTRVDRTTGSTTVTTTYGLDNADNRTSRTVGPPPPPPGPLSVSLSTTTWMTGDPWVTATPSGGVAPYDYQWTRVSGSTRLRPTHATGASTSWEFRVFWEYAQTAYYRVTVSDSVGAEVQSSQVEVTVYPDA